MRTSFKKLKAYCTYKNIMWLGCGLLVLGNCFLAGLLAQEYHFLSQNVNHLQEIQANYAHQSKQLQHVYHNLVENPDSVGLPDQSLPFLHLNRDPQHIQKVALLPILKPTKHVITPKKEVKQKKAKSDFFALPIDRELFWISTYYGTKQRKRFHAGLDMASPDGTPVKASADGIVHTTGNVGKFGNMILLSHNEEYKTRYAHLSNILVDKGDEVKKGQVIGNVGKSGSVTGKNGYHLHFEIISYDHPVNPLEFLTL